MGEFESFLYYINCANYNNNWYLCLKKSALHSAQLKRGVLMTPSYTKIRREKHVSNMLQLVEALLKNKIYTVLQCLKLIFASGLPWTSELLILLVLEET